MTLQVTDFLAECTVRGLDESDLTPVADLYGIYLIWCEKREVKAASLQNFSRQVKNLGVPSKRICGMKVYQSLLPTGPIPIQYIMETDRGPGPNVWNS